MKIIRFYIIIGVLASAIITCVAVFAVNSAKNGEGDEVLPEISVEIGPDAADASNAHIDKPMQSDSPETEPSETQPATGQPTEVQTGTKNEPVTEQVTEPPTEQQETWSTYEDEQNETEQKDPEYSEPTKYEQALAVARSLASDISGENDLERVTKAAQTVAEYSSRATYTMSGEDYASAYGVFVKGEYSCAGSTRALIMLLECMGYSPRHINENLYTHQWVELTMDGKTGWADGQVGMADYGDFPFAVKETG